MEFYYLKTVNKCEVKGLGQKSWIFAIYAFDNTVHCNLIVATAIFFLSEDMRPATPKPDF